MEQDAFAWEGSEPAAPSASPPRRLPARAWVAAFALLAVLVAGGVLLLDSGGPGGGSTPVSLAAYTSAQQLGFRYDISVDASVAGSNISITGSGAINVRPSLSGSMSVSVLGRTVDEIASGSYIYVQTAPETWDRESLPADDASSMAENPTATLSFLRAAGSVSDVGEEAVNGAVTTHYHAVVDLNRLASLEPGKSNMQMIAEVEHVTGGSTLPIDAWIDSSHLVRRLSIAIPISREGVTAAATVTMNFLAYGAQPVVAPPPAGEVADLPSSSGV